MTHAVQAYTKRNINNAPYTASHENLYVCMQLHNALVVSGVSIT